MGYESDDVSCKGIRYGIENFKEGKKKNIIIKEKVEIEYSIDLSGIIISSIHPTQNSLYLFSSTIKMEDIILYSILNNANFSLSISLFSLFSFFFIFLFIKYNIHILLYLF